MLANLFGKGQIAQGLSLTSATAVAMAWVLPLYWLRRHCDKAAFENCDNSEII